MNGSYPVLFSVEYPDRSLNRLTTALRFLTVIPIAIVLGAISGYSARWGKLLSFANRVGVYIALMDDRYPSTFRYIEGVIRWHNRVVGYAFILVTDEYPPFRLRA